MRCTGGNLGLSQRKIYESGHILWQTEPEFCIFYESLLEIYVKASFALHTRSIQLLWFLTSKVKICFHWWNLIRAECILVPIFLLLLSSSTRSHFWQWYLILGHFHFWVEKPPTSSHLYQTSQYLCLPDSPTFSICNLKIKKKKKEKPLSFNFLSFLSILLLLYICRLCYIYMYIYILCNTLFNTVKPFGIAFM